MKNAAAMARRCVAAVFDVITSILDVMFVRLTSIAMGWICGFLMGEVNKIIL